MHAGASRINAQQFAAKTGAKNTDGRIFIDLVVMLLSALGRGSHLQGSVFCLFDLVRFTIERETKSGTPPFSSGCQLRGGIGCGTSDTCSEGLFSEVAV
ncbi:hypothetical protein [Syntrophotalea acetylenivorans]|uniref:hypothetical protein n=1 Tax=Syntrophotalea acetylenivorans TaxID=1842532 RepID=UPI001F2CEF67|nr:hypothetical protein [Syntrophotalea acetylenivorans]